MSKSDNTSIVNGSMLKRLKPDHLRGHQDIMSQMLAIRRQALAACPEAMETLIDMANGDIYINRDQFRAIQELFDRGLGKAHQSIEVSNIEQEAQKEFIDMSTAQLSLLASNKVEQFLISMYKNGNLQEFVKKMDLENKGK